MGFPAWKTRRLDEAVRADRAPQIVILGSSRVMQVQPAYLEALTGRRAFNYGLPDAYPFELLAQVRYLLRCGAKPEMLVVGVDEFTFGDRPLEPHHFLLAGHPGLWAEVPAPERLRVVLGAWQSMRDETTFKSLVRLCRIWPTSPRSFRDAQDVVLEDGWTVFPKATLARARGEFNLAQRIAATAAEYRGRFHIDQPEGVRALHPHARNLEYFRQLLELAHAEQIEVRVLLTPLQPALEREIVTPEIAQVRREVSARLRDLCDRYGAVYRDFTDLASFGGEPDEFADGNHVTSVNARRMMDTLLEIDPATRSARAPTDWEIVTNPPSVNNLTTE
jgi:hypothetical protein